MTAVAHAGWIPPNALKVVLVGNSLTNELIGQIVYFVIAV